MSLKEYKQFVLSFGFLVGWFWFSVLSASAGECFAFGCQRSNPQASSGGVSSADISAPGAFLPELFSITTSNTYF